MYQKRFFGQSDPYKRCYLENEGKKRKEKMKRKNEGENEGKKCRKHMKGKKEAKK